jgi:hypothetical protein
MPNLRRIVGGAERPGDLDRLHEILRSDHFKEGILEILRRADAPLDGIRISTVASEEMDASERLLNELFRFAVRSAHPAVDPVLVAVGLLVSQAGSLLPEKAAGPINGIIGFLKGRSHVIEVEIPKGRH